MEQENLLEKVRELFERQDFDVKQVEVYHLEASNDEILSLKVFSSEKYSEEEITELVDLGDKVFVDKDLESIRDKIENSVSVLEEETEEPDFDLPSYELIGDIAVINDLAGRDEEESVAGIRHHHPRVKTVLLKTDGLQGEFRVGNYRKLYGTKTETIHKEHGCRYKVDPTKVYYSERFATDRKRVVDQIEDGEKVLAMFAGVGPFAVLAAKDANPERVVAIEKNPGAAEYLKENIGLNRVENTVEGFEGDVKNILPEIDEVFDRIIMPLPGSAEEFLDLAFEYLKTDGVVHYYRFMEEDNWQELEDEVKRIAERENISFNIVGREVSGERSPGVVRARLDIQKE